MAVPPRAQWVDWGSACMQIRDYSGVSHAVGMDMERHLIEALRDGEVRARRTDNGQELQPQFWINGKKALEAAERFSPLMAVEIHLGGLEAWLSPASPGGRAGPGRRAKYDWEGMWIEVAHLANTPDGLPETQASLVDHLETWFEDTVGNSPARSSIEERISRLYTRLFPGK